MKRLLLVALAALAIGLPAEAQFDFLTTGTRGARVWETTCSPTVPSLSAPNMSKWMVPCAGVPGYSAGTIYISENGGPWTQLSSFVGSGAVASVFGRIGSIAAQQSDYDSFFLTQTEGDARYRLQSTALVTAFNSRTGAVTPTAGDYTAAQVTNTPANGIVGITVQAAIDELGAQAAGVINVKAHGAVGNGIADDTVAIQAAITAAQSSGKPVFIPAGTYKLTDSLTATTPITILGAGTVNTHILQTGAAKYIFFLGPASTPHAYGWAISGLHLATAAGSYDAIYMRNSKTISLSDIVVSASGRYGLTFSNCQEVHARSVHNSGYYQEITGQNETGGSQGVWGDGATFGAAWRFTNDTTTVSLIGCDVAISTGGIETDSQGLALTWIGTGEGLVLPAISGTGASSFYHLNLYLDGNGDTPGGINLTSAIGGSIFLRNSDENGVTLVSSKGIDLSGYINRVSVAADCQRITGRNITYGQVQPPGGYIYDLSPDGRWTDCRSGATTYLHVGKIGNASRSVSPNSNFERWTGTTAPNGWEVYNGATVTKESGAGNIYSGSYSAKIVGHASNASTGLRFTLSPVSMFVGRHVTVTGRYKAAAAAELTYMRDGGATEGMTLPASGTAWAKFEATIAIPAGDTVARIILDANPTATVYFDDVDILIGGYDLALPQTLDTTATPSVSLESVPVTSWKFANGSPTTVTSFPGCYGGLEYTIQLDANTTLQHGAAIQLDAQANKTGAGTVLRFLCDSENGVMRQIGREKTTATGAWITPAFSAGNFTASTGDWTVESGDVATYAYKVTDQKTLTVAWRINTSTVSATPSALRIAIPGGFVAAKAFFGPWSIVENNGGTLAVGGVNVAASGTTIQLYANPGGTTNWATATNTTSVYGSVTIEIQ